MYWITVQWSKCSTMQCSALQNITALLIIWHYRIYCGLTLAVTSALADPEKPGAVLKTPLELSHKVLVYLVLFKHAPI